MKALFKRLKSFTLVELLVVVAIIAVLVGLLTPAIAGARERTRRVKCVSNLRQIGLGMKMYATDNNGDFPDKYLGSTVNCYEHLRPLSNVLSNVGYIFTCPSDKDKTMTNKLITITDNNISYDYVRNQNTTIDAIDAPLCFDRGLTTEIDNQVCSVYADDTWAATAPHNIHGGNILFVGLHATFNATFPRDGPNAHNVVIP